VNILVPKSPALLLVLLTSVAPVYAGTADEADFDSTAEAYVAEGLHSNLQLRSQTLEVEKAASVLQAARAQFFPSLDFQARYTKAHGGREIDFPAGDLLNPVYSTLNELLAAQGQNAPFGQVANQSIDFLRDEQDTRFLLRQPVFSRSLSAAVRAQSALLDASSFREMALGRTLRRDITVAYADVLKARSSVGIVESSEALLRENVRVNESLFANGKTTEDQVLRAKAELLRVEQQRREAANGATQALSYFNFLLNRDLRTDVIATEPSVERLEQRGALEQLWGDALDRRPELKQLTSLARASEAQVDIARAQHWPTLSIGVDAGVQGENYHMGPGYNFSTVSLLFTWRVFSGGADNARIRESRAAERQVKVQQEELAQQIRLEVEQTWDRLQTARDSLRTAQARAEAARAGFRIASRKRDEGIISQVEFMDARDALTSAELNLNLTRFDVVSRRADLEYATSSGNLPLPARGI
jgi:outer membrane protein TolC